MAIDIHTLKQLPKDFFEEFKNLPAESDFIMSSDTAISSLALDYYYNQDYYWVINQYNNLKPLPYIPQGTPVRVPSKVDVETLITKWLRKTTPTNSVKKIRTNL
jgi:hypothetical protein